MSRAAAVRVAPAGTVRAASAPKRRRRRRLRWVLNHVFYVVTVGLIGALRVLSRPLPARWVAALGRPLGWVAWAAAGTERRRALRNLARVRPELPPPQRRALVRRVFVDLGRSAMECLACRAAPHSLDGDGLAMATVRFADGALRALREALDEQRGVIFVTAHFGNWELMAAAVARQAPVHVLARGSYDPRFTRLIARQRARWGVRCIWVDRPMHLRHALVALRRRGVLGVLIDTPVRQGTWAPFLGHLAPTTRIVEALALRTGAAVVAGFVERVRPAAHVVHVRRLGGPAPTLTRQAAEVVESAVARCPDQWLWTLDRWRFGP